MSKTSPLLVFDLDGTLAETAPDLINTLNHVLTKEGLRELPLSEARPMIGAGMRVLIRRGFAVEGIELSDEKTESLFHDFLAYYEAHIAEKTTLYPGLIAALDRFEAAGWHFAVCTNKIERTARQLLKELGIDHRFRFICGQDTFHVSKPDGVVLRLTVERAGGSLDNTLMIGDSKTDIDTARNANVPVVAMTFGYTDKPVAAYEPDRALDHYDELWEAVSQIRAGAGLPMSGS